MRRLALGTVVATYLLIVWGGVVRVTGSGLGCGSRDDWPLCEGGLLPPLRQDALIEFTHRWLAAIATTLVAVLAVAAWRGRRRLPGVAAAAVAAVALFAVQIALGAVTVELRLPGWVILVHLANALLLLGALVDILVLASTAGTERERRREALRAAGGRGAPGWGLVAVATAAVYVLVLSGGLVVARGAGGACAGWPLCGGGLDPPEGALAAVNVLHRLVAGGVTVLVAVALMRLGRRSVVDRPVGIAAAAAAALLLAQIAAGALVVELRLPAAARGVHLALASALWGVVLGAALLSRSLAARDEGAGRQPGARERVAPGRPAGASRRPA